MIVSYEAGTGYVDVEYGLGLLAAILRVVAWSAMFAVGGRCAECGCTHYPCPYCAHECLQGNL